jgi:putative transposase
MAALKHAILSKSEHLKVHPDLKNSWDVYGVPSTLVLDNGTEFHSPDFVMACQCLGINIQYTKARSPWLKGTIERFFGSLNKSLLAGMKGYTFPNIDARGDYDPKKNAVIGLRELNTLIYGWIVDFHNQRAKRKGLGIPAVLWAQSVRRFPIPHVSSASDVGVALMSADWRTLTRKGIEFRNLEYNSPELEPITRSLGDGTRVLIKFSPADVGSIYVIHPRTGIPIYVPAKNPMMRKGISEWALAAIHRYSNSLNAGGQRVSLSEAMMSLIDKGKAAAAEAKTGEMSRQAMKFLRDFLHHDFSESDNVSPEGINVQSRPVRVVADPVVQEEFKRVEKEEIKQRLGDDEDWGSGQR